MFQCKEVKVLFYVVFIIYTFYIAYGKYQTKYKVIHSKK